MNVRLCDARRALVPCALMTIIAMFMLVSPARAVLGSVSADWPATKIARGSTVSVTGHVGGLQLSDGVFLQQKVLGGWRNISKTRLDGDNNYKLAIPAWWLGTRTYRVMSASLLNSTLLGNASTAWTVDVVPTYTPGGYESQYKYSTSTYARWDPCRTIGYRVNARQATSGAIKDVQGAFTRLGHATGFHFVYRGTTTGIPQNGGNSWYPAGTQIVVAWARPDQSSMLRLYSNAVGVGSAITSGGYVNGDGTSVSRIIRGAVVLDSRRNYRAGFGTGSTRGDLVLHELGHTMGLGHVGSTKQIMYPMVTSGLARLGRGDLNGLERHGARLGCVKEATYRTDTSSEAFAITAMP
jgi:hypothetical protein